MMFNRTVMNTRYGIIKYFKPREFTRYQSTITSSTIFSLSSGQGKCGVAVIRVSGPQSQSVFQTIASFPKNGKIEPRFAYLRKLKHPITNEIIDRGLCLWFPGPKSFTGEDCCEFQVHGGLAVIVSLLDALNSIDGLTAAKAGEFTKRAFYAGKLDLTEVEGLADLIHAETEQQRKQALLQADGSLSKLYQNWRKLLIRCVAHLEAYTDFAEDQNIESDTLVQVEQEVVSIENEIMKHLNDGRRGEILRYGVRTAIFGAPNVGKSSFMNKICQKPISIVTDIEGTTRDVIESSFNISGYPVVFADTAGLRKNTTDIVEREGIARTRRCVELADFIVLMMSAIEVMNSRFGLDEYKARMTMAQTHRNDIAFVSCKDDIGLVDAVSNITQNLKGLCGEPTADNPNLSQQRHRHLLEECLQFLNKIKDTSNQTDLAIAAQHLRMAIRCIGQCVHSKLEEH